MKVDKNAAVCRVFALQQDNELSRATPANEAVVFQPASMYWCR
jgi:hypothetical protein